MTKGYSREIEDGFGCSGLLPTRAEREEERERIRNINRVSGLESEIARLQKVWEDTRTQRDELLSHIAGKSPLPEWAVKWLRVQKP